MKMRVKQLLQGGDPETTIPPPLPLTPPPCNLPTSVMTVPPMGVGGTLAK